MKIMVFTLIIIALAYVVGIFSTQKLHTEININAPPNLVWSNLTNFEKHKDWNPFIKNISGQLSVGSQLSVTIQPPGKDSMDFKPELLVVQQNQELRWLGRVLIPKLFDGEHYFILKETEDGKTLFIQGEKFSGILALILWGGMEQDTKNGFEAMNRAIKARSETSQ